MKSMFIKNFLLLTIFYLLFVSCQNPFDPPKLEKPVAGERGYFSLAIDQNPGRTILPVAVQSDFTQYKLEFFAAGTTVNPVTTVSRNNNNLADSVELPVGTWDLRVSAYLSSQIAAQGSLSNITIVAGQTVNRNVTLEPIKGSGTGTFRWNISFENFNNVTVASMTITPLDTATGTAEMTRYFMGGTPAIDMNSSLTLNTGYYRVVFKLYNNEELSIERWEILHIYQNMESAFAWTATQLTPVTISYNANGWTGGGVPAAPKQGTTGQPLGVANYPALQDTAAQRFVGWALTAAGNTVSAGYIIPVGTAALTLYVVWAEIIPAGQPITITYNANGWAGGGIPTTLGNGISGQSIGAANLPALTDTATQTFLGWSLTTGGVLVDASYVPTGNITLYVIWNPVQEQGTPITINYDANGWTGGGIPAAPATGVSGIALTAALLPTLTSTATQTFLGWSLTPGGPTITTFYSPQGSITLYVRWTAIGLVTDNDADLTSLTFNGAAVDFGAGGSDYSAIPDDAVGSATVLSSTVIVVATPEVSGAEVMFDKVTGSKEPVFWYDTEFIFATGDFLAIEVTATDGTTKKYYKIAITVADVALQSLAIGDTAVTLPSPATEWENAVVGSVLFDYPARAQPTGGLAVTATLNAVSAGADVQYGHATGTNEPVFSAASTITFVNGEYLYVKVSKDGNDAYYKVAVNFQTEGVIKYGSPRVGTDEEKYIDPLWDDPFLDIYPIEKPYMNDLTATGRQLLAQGRVATGIAKALWDEDGLYLYVVVTDPNGVSELDKSGSEAHEADSVELFVNEGDPLKASPTATGSATYTRGGSHYRIGANGGRSGEGDSPAALEALNRTSAWKTETGYIVIFQAPWRLRDRFPIYDGKEIGFEIQINDAPPLGQRHAVMVWNNVSHTNYQNAADYGIAILDADGHTLSFPAVVPAIDTQPQSKVVSSGESVTLTVAAAVTDGGSLSYQWYSAETGSGEGTPLAGETNTTYTFTASTEDGNYFYYVEVTNSLNNTAKTVRSAVVAVIVSSGEEEEDWQEKITNVNTSAPVYGFNIPDGKTFGDYDRIVFKLKMDSASATTSGRLRAWGNYSSTSWTLNGDRLTGTAGGNSMGNASPGGLLLSTAGQVEYSGVTDWTEQVIELTYRDTLDAAATIKAASGIVTLAFAIIPPGGGQGTYTWYVKDIVLSNADGTETVTALKPDSALLWAGTGASAYVTQDPANDSVTRILQ